MRMQLLKSGCTIAVIASLILLGHLDKAGSAPVSADHPQDTESRQNVQPQRSGQLISQEYRNKQNSPDRGQVPGRYRGTGSRDGCPAVNVPLTAIVPIWRDASQIAAPTYVGGLTASERPDFWFYVPYDLTNFKAEFILRDGAGEPIYQLASSDFSPTNISPGIVRLSLPATVAPLEIGQVYQWSFRIYCNSEVPILLNGGIERLPLDSALSQQLETASPLDKARLYAENGFWYDAITVSGDYWRSRPREADAVNAWKQLLQSLGIEDVAAILSGEP